MAPRESLSTTDRLLLGILEELRERPAVTRAEMDELLRLHYLQPRVEQARYGRKGGYLQRTEHLRWGGQQTLSFGLVDTTQGKSTGQLIKMSEPVPQAWCILAVVDFQSGWVVGDGQWTATFKIQIGVGQASHTVQLVLQTAAGSPQGQQISNVNTSLGGAFPAMALNVSAQLTGNINDNNNPRIALVSCFAAPLVLPP